jgi:hypothetical protein
MTTIDEKRKTELLSGANALLNESLSSIGSIAEPT